MIGAYTRRWETRRGGARRDAAGEDAPPATNPNDDTYYGLPVIHGPHWNWLIVLYFYLGGIAGASYALATIADLLGGPGNRRIARAGRSLALATVLPCPVLLTLDLGRPARFHHMLRVLKLRSPLSVGTWTLVAFSALAGLGAVAQAAEDGLLPPGSPPGRAGRALPARALGVAGLPPALFFGGYTGALLGATAVPLWQRNAALLGPLFLASSFANASAALSLLLAAGRRPDRAALARLERFDTLAQVVELALLLAAEARLDPAVARPLRSKPFGPVYRGGVLGVGLAVPLALRLVGRLRGGRAERPATVLASCCALVGGLLFRYVILYAGRQSAADPRATFAATRADETAPGG